MSFYLPFFFINEEEIQERTKKYELIFLCRLYERIRIFFSNVTGGCKYSREI